jgi:hypothetical protein
MRKREIKITDEMIRAGLEVLRDEGFPSYTRRATDPGLMENVLRAALGANRHASQEDSAPHRSAAECRALTAAVQEA